LPVVGASVVAGGLVSALDGGGACCVGGADCPGFGGWGLALPAGGAEEAGVVLIPGAGAVLSPEFNPIATAVPTSKIATAVPMINTTGSRYQGMTDFFDSERGGAGCWNFTAGRADV
jgi:hypothetical protein